MNKKDLADLLAKKLSTQKEAQDAVDNVFDELVKALKSGDKVVISGFGTFRTVITKVKKGRDPRTGKTIHISPKKKIKFKQSRELF